MIPRPAAEKAQMISVLGRIGPDALVAYAEDIPITNTDEGDTLSILFRNKLACQCAPQHFISTSLLEPLCQQIVPF